VRQARARQERKEKKGVLFGSALLLKAARGGGRGRRKWWARTAAERQWKRWAKPWVNKTVAAAIRTRSAWPGRLCSDRGTNGWAPCSFDFFFQLSKPAETWKLKIDTLPCCKNSQFLHVARFGHYEQFSQLCRYPILNRIRVKHP
jgi:hypothetical protein